MQCRYFGFLVYCIWCLCPVYVIMVVNVLIRAAKIQQRKTFRIPISSEKQSSILGYPGLHNQSHHVPVCLLGPSNSGMHRNTRDQTSFTASNLPGERRSFLPKNPWHPWRFEHCFSFSTLEAKSYYSNRGETPPRATAQTNKILWSNTKTKVWFNHWVCMRLFTAHLLNVAFY